MSNSTQVPSVVAASTDAALVPVFLSAIGGVPAHVCDGRALHAFLEVGELFAAWIKALIEKYGFQQDQDFAIAMEKSIAKRGGHNRIDYLLCLDMAKEVSMVQNNARGREARRYFIAMERKALEAAGQLAPAGHVETLLPSEQRILTEIALAHAVGLSDEVLRPVMEDLWDRLAKRFGVTRASEIPRARLAEAILYVTGMDVRAIPQAAPEPTPAPEYLTNNDMANLACLIDRIQQGKRMPQAWRFSIWKDLRRVTHTKSPDKLEVRHLPDMADELLRIHTAVAILDAAIRKAEKEVLRRVFRNGEEDEQVVAQIEAQILTQSISDAANMTKALDAWQRREVQALRGRTAAYLGLAHYPEGLEPTEVAA